MHSLMQTIHNIHVLKTPPHLDKPLSSMQAHDNQWGRGRRTRKEEEGQKKEGRDEIGANLAKFQDKA